VEKNIVAKSREVKPGSNLVESSKEGCDSKDCFASDHDDDDDDLKREAEIDIS
jgi:hypothetical protein